MSFENRLFNQIANGDKRIIEGSRKAAAMASELRKRISETIDFIKKNKIKNVYLRNPVTRLPNCPDNSPFISTHPQTEDVTLSIVIGSTERPTKFAQMNDIELEAVFDIEKQRATLRYDYIIYNTMQDVVYTTVAEASFEQYDFLETELEKFLAAEMRKRMMPQARIALANAKAINRRTECHPDLPHYC